MNLQVVGKLRFAGFGGFLLDRFFAEKVEGEACNTHILGPRMSNVQDPYKSRSPSGPQAPLDPKPCTMQTTLSTLERKSLQDGLAILNSANPRSELDSCNMPEILDFLGFGLGCSPLY